MGRRRLSGLRLRLVAALVATSALTLAVAALALLSPLERRLRHDEIEGLRESGVVVRAVLAEVPSEQVHPHSRVLDAAIRDAAERVDAQVVVVSRDGRVLGSSVNHPGFRAAQAVRALHTAHPTRGIVGGGSDALAVYSRAAHAGDRPIGFTVSRTLVEVNAAERVVRRAGLAAALVGLAAALLFGLALAARLARRLRRLRDAALHVAQLGSDVDVPADPTSDEVGDLARALSTMQERLRRQEEARRTFVSTASHELRTPLSSLSLTLELAREELARPDRDIDTAMTEVARAERQAARLTALAEQLLDLSRIDSGVALERRALDVAPLAESVAHELADRPGAHDHPLVVRAEPGARALGDPGAVMQILRIVVDNALRFSPPGAAVDIDVSAADGHCAIRVSDRGPGIPEHEREMIFERFRRGSRPSGGGFGLGLAIGRELARRMAGDLVLHANQPGTCMELRLAGAPPPPSPEPELSTPAAATGRAP